MKREKDEKTFSKQLCKAILGSRETPRSGGIRGWGGDVDINVTETFTLVAELKRELPIGKGLSKIWEKIQGEAKQRLRTPILMDSDITIIGTDEFIDIINKLYSDDISGDTIQ